MTSVFVLGQPDNGRRIARLLDSEAIQADAVFVEPRNYANLLATAPRSRDAVVMRVGYRIGASTPRGRVFDAFWSLLRLALPNAVRCHYWLGTDVQETVRESQAGTLRWSHVASAREDLHLTVAPWLTSELQSIGIPAITALLPSAEAAPIVAPALPVDFSVLTYLPSVRFDFYGGRTIIEAAARMPTVRFDIVGGPGDPPRARASNIHWHGWVKDIAERYAQATVVVRIPEHDGFGNTVIEGLLNARHVIYTHEVPFVRHVSSTSPDGLVAALKEFHDAHLRGQLDPNLDGRAYARVAFDDRTLMFAIASHLIPKE